MPDPAGRSKPVASTARCIAVGLSRGGEPRGRNTSACIIQIAHSVVSHVTTSACGLECGCPLVSDNG